MPRPANKSRAAGHFPWISRGYCLFPFGGKCHSGGIPGKPNRSGWHLLCFCLDIGWSHFWQGAAVRVQEAATHMFSMGVKIRKSATANNQGSRKIWLTHPGGNCVAARKFLTMVQCLLDVGCKTCASITHWMLAVAPFRSLTISTRRSPLQVFMSTRLWSVMFRALHPILQRIDWWVLLALMCHLTVSFTWH